MKKVIFGGRIFASLILFWGASSCRRSVSVPMHVYSGYAQGTTFQVTYDTLAGILDREISDIFSKMDKACSLYDSNSAIVRFNRAVEKAEVDTLMASVLMLSKKIYQETHGAFNPAVFPLVKMWGFGPQGSQGPPISSVVVPTGDSLKSLINLEGIFLDTTEDGKIWCHKKVPHLQLDFNGIAQGYTVDLICGLLEKKGARNYLVEVGGEVRASGLNPQGQPWRIGIEKPTDHNLERQLYAVVNLSDMAMATSGSYRKFYIQEGVRRSHTISPFTGRPVTHNLLSVTVFCSTCARADALATAFMVMGNTGTLSWLRQHPGYEVFMISSGYQQSYITYASEGIKSRLEAIRP
ncbi:MAG: FAD:protein FMN transferase [Flavobacteriales bacterium]|nr:FAD:protein FMN transferase [Flavobacteriales bacterium]MCX7768167.1 FAD:protein FMN transferase [Flavobacteriales bacterium]MDW8409119.1 FAD:protein FMN transferase [Flavobacteriales bacterium]